MWKLWDDRFMKSLNTSSGQVIAAVGLITTLILGSFGYDQWQRYDTSLAKADRDTRNAAVLLAENTARTFEGITATLHEVVSLRRDAEAGLYRDDGAFHKLLKAIDGSSPALSAIGWIDAQGNPVASSLPASQPPSDIAGQEHFTAQRAGKDGGERLYIAAPIRSPLSDGMIFNVSLRLEAADGRFAGIAAGVVDPNYFAAVYRSIELAPSRIAALYRGDGTILVREPPMPDRLGRSVADADWFRGLAPRGPAGTFHARNYFDGTERIASYARVPGRAELVSVSISRDDALGDFRLQLLQAGARLGLLLSALFIGAWLLIRQLRRQQRADGMFRDLLEAAPDAMVILDRQSRITLVNAQAERLFGWERRDLIGQPIEALIPERLRARHPAMVAEFARAPQNRPMGANLDLWGLRRDGSEFPVEVSLSPLRTEGGLFVSSAIRDITERKKAEAELIDSRKAAESANRAKSEFLSSMSHELRTPLNALIGFAQMLELDRDRNLTDRQREYVAYLRRAGDHLLELVNEVLDLAGIEAGRLRLTIEQIALREMVEQVGRIMSPIAERSKIAFSVHVPEGIPDIRADELRLRQVLINLVSNAVKYNRAGGAVRLDVERGAGDRVRILVTDTGLGIAPELQKDLFQPFQRLGAERSDIEGTGIGLTLSRKLIEAMNGNIGFESQPGRGSTFWIDLPVDALLQAPSAAAPGSGETRARAGGYSLLYVEDNPTNLRLMEHLLSTLSDVAMLSAPTPQLGLDLAVAHRPDVIVLDINLPGMSGFELLSRLQANPATRDIPVLALTAAAFPRDAKKGLAAGFFRYITKPLDVKIFLAAIDDALVEGSRRRMAGAQEIS